MVSAYEAFSRGLINRRAESFESLDRAVVLFERAVALTRVRARAPRARRGLRGQGRLPVDAGAERSRPREPEARDGAPAGIGPRLARAGRHADVRRPGREAIAALRRALAIDPDEASALGSMGRVLFVRQARFREAAEWFERALEKNANAGWYWLQLAHCAALLREFDRGERAAARAVELQEAFLSGREGLFIAGGYMRAGHLAALRGRHPEAVDFFQREIDFVVRTEHPLRHRIPVELNARLGASYQRLGESQKARRGVRRGARKLRAPRAARRRRPVHALLRRRHPRDARRGGAGARVPRARHDQQPAFTAARAAIEPEFEGLRADPRFQRLVQSAQG